MCRYGVEEGQNFYNTWGGLPEIIFALFPVGVKPIIHQSDLRTYYGTKKGDLNANIS
jgi:hypothetical protein